MSNDTNSVTPRVERSRSVGFVSSVYTASAVGLCVDTTELVTFKGDQLAKVFITGIS